MGMRQRKLGATAEKERRQVEKSLKTTSHILGFRMCGLQSFNRAENQLSYRDKYWGRKLTREKVPDAMRQWFWNGRVLYVELVPIVLEKLSSLYNCIAELRHYRFWSSSLLWVYDGGSQDHRGRIKSLDIRMIDFANTIYLPDNPAVDEEYLFGLRNLMDALNQILTNPVPPPMPNSSGRSTSGTASYSVHQQQQLRQAAASMLADVGAATGGSSSSSSSSSSTTLSHRRPSSYHRSSNKGHTLPSRTPPSREDTPRDDKALAVPPDTMTDTLKVSSLVSTWKDVEAGVRDAAGSPLGAAGGECEEGGTCGNGGRIHRDGVEDVSWWSGKPGSRSASANAESTSGQMPTTIAISRPSEVPVGTCRAATGSGAGGASRNMVAGGGIERPRRRPGAARARSRRIMVLEHAGGEAAGGSHLAASPISAGTCLDRGERKRRQRRRRPAGSAPVIAAAGAAPAVCGCKERIGHQPECWTLKVTLVESACGEASDEVGDSSDKGETVRSTDSRSRSVFRRVVSAPSLRNVNGMAPANAQMPHGG